MTADIRPYPVYKDSGVPWLGQVPEQWQVSRLKRISRFAYGDSLPTETRQEGNVPVFGSNGRVGFHTAANTHAPCIIIGRKGSFGKVNFSQVPVFAIDTTYFVDDRYTHADLRWLSYLLGSLKLDGISKDSAVPGLAREDAYAQHAAYPASIDEQAAIVRYLDHADRKVRHAIGARQQLIKLLTEQKQAIIQHAVTGGLDPSVAPAKAGAQSSDGGMDSRLRRVHPSDTRTSSGGNDGPPRNDGNVRLKPSGVPWLGDVPEHWEVRRLKTVSHMKSGESITSLAIEQAGEYPVYGGNGLRGYTSAYTHDGEYALIGRQGALCGNVHHVHGRFWASEHAVVASLRDRYDLSWFCSLLDVMNLNQYSMAAAQPGLAVEQITNLWIPVPPEDEQRQVSGYLDGATANLDKAIDAARREISLLREYRTRLMADVVTGKLDVRDAAAHLPDEPEEQPEPLDEEPVAEMGDLDAEESDGDQAGNESRDA